MSEFSPERLLRTLEAHGVAYVVIGAQAALIHGAPVVTSDLDVTPAGDPENLERIAAALRDLGARLRTPGDVDGVPFPIDSEMLVTAQSWTLTTTAGDLDLVFVPAGTRGYDDLASDATRFTLGDDLVVSVASLADVIRTKEAANRAKDRGQLPILRETLEMIRAKEHGKR